MSQKMSTFSSSPVSYTLKNRIQWTLRWQSIAAALAVIFLLAVSEAKAADWEIQLHQGSDAETQGLSLAVSDKFSRRSNYYWHASYNKINDIAYPWNNKDQYIPVSTLDASLGYRLSRKTFNSTAKGLSVEFQLGATMSLLDTELTFPQDESLPTTTLAEIGDVAPIIATTFNYKTSQFSSVTFGVKHIVDFADIGDVTTVYIGFSYQIGNRQYGL